VYALPVTGLAELRVRPTGFEQRLVRELVTRGAGSGDYAHAAGSLAPEQLVHRARRDAGELGQVPDGERPAGRGEDPEHVKGEIASLMLEQPGNLVPGEIALVHGE
jgi:hypothetical protein